MLVGCWWGSTQNIMKYIAVEILQLSCMKTELKFFCAFLEYMILQFRPSNWNSGYATDVKIMSYLSPIIFWMKQQSIQASHMWFVNKLQ